MFTGLITGLGTILETQKITGENGHSLRLRIETPYSNLTIGESIAVNGVCLTVETFEDNKATFFLSPETLKVTYFSDIKDNSVVNLERALRVGDPLGGHWVQGHVDGFATLQDIEQNGQGYKLTVKLPHTLSPYVAHKGSIAIEGISLTINAIEHHNTNTLIYLQIIPHTWEHTTLHLATVGQLLHIEVDILAKYLETLLSRKHSEEAAPWAT